MSFIAKIKNPVFWSNFFRVVVPFFIIVTLFSLFMNSWREIFAGDFAAVSETNFSGGKWKNFWGIKVFITVFYGLYITNKNMK
tara:strand:- start:356 stop:604 length:249 start_codon:yes stop_codon:yes gene_type:complete